MALKILSITAIVTVALIISGLYPPVAVMLTALGITFLFLLFKDVS